MRRFRFQLDRVVRVREIEHDQRLAAWQEAHAAALVAFALLESLRRSLEQEQRALLELQERGECSLADSLAHHARFEQLEAKIRAARERAATLEKLANELREPWEAARRELRAVRKLEERRRADHVAEELHCEGLEQDERASARAGAERASRAWDAARRESST